MQRLRRLTMAVLGSMILAATSLHGDVNDTWDWKNDPATGKPKRRLVVGFDSSISNFLAATGYSLEDIAHEAADNWNQHTSVSGWEFVFTNNPAGADVVIMSGESPVPNGGASASRGTNTSGAVVQARVIFDPTPQAKKRDAAGRPEFDPDTGEQLVNDLTWGTNGVGILDLVTVTKHEFSHLLRKKHNKDANGKERHDTGNLCDPASAGNHQREPSGADVTNITISATQAVKRASGTVAPGIGANMTVLKTQTAGVSLQVPGNAPTNGMALYVTPLEGLALPSPDGLWPAFGRVALGVGITSSSPGSRFANPATATLFYDDALWQNRHTGAVDERTLLPFRFDPGTQSWTPVPLLSRDPVANTISFPVSNLNATVYGIAGKELAVTNRHNLVVYVSDGDTRWENFDIYAMDMDTRMTSRLTSHPEIDNHPEISPDGKWLIWSSTRGGSDFDLYLADLANVEGTWHQLTRDDPNGPQPTHPDRHPHFHTVDPRIIVYTSKTLPLAYPVQVVSECSQPKIIVPPRFYETLNVMRLDPTGNVQTNIQLDIRVAWDSAGKTNIWTTNTCTYAGHPSFSHSGTRIVFSASIDGEGKVWEVYTVGFDTNALALVPNSLVRVTSGPAVGPNPIQMSGGAHFSEDDSAIYFSSTRTPDGNSQIFSVPAASENVPVTGATRLTSHPGNDYVPEPLMDGRFLVTSDLGAPGLCGQTNGPSEDLDIALVGAGGARVNLTDNDASHETLLLADEVSWFCGAPPNLSACRSYPRVYTIESLWLERGAWKYLKGLAPWTLIPDGLLAKHGYPDQAVRMYATGWKNMETAMAGEHAGWPDILFHLDLMDQMAPFFPGLTDGPALRNWMQMTQPVRTMKVVSESIMYGLGIGASWQPWVSTWTNAAGGNFDDRANWDLDVPTTNDTARFDGRRFDVVTTGRVIRVDLSGDRSIATVPIEMVQLNLVSVLTNPPTVTVSNNITISLSTNFSGLTVSNVDLTVTNRSSNGEIKIGTNGHLRARGAKVRADKLQMESGSTLDLDFPATSFFDVYVPVDIPPSPCPPYITVGSGGVFRAASGIRLGGTGVTGSAVRVMGGTLVVTNSAGTGTAAVAGGLLGIARGGTARVNRLSLSGTNSSVGVWNVDSFFDITYRIDFTGSSNRLIVGTGAVVRCPDVRIGGDGNVLRNGGGALVVTNGEGTATVQVGGSTLELARGICWADRVIATGASSRVFFSDGVLRVVSMVISNGRPLVVQGLTSNQTPTLILGGGTSVLANGGVFVGRLFGKGTIRSRDLLIFLRPTILRPGDSPGVVTIEGDAELAEGATYEADLGGLVAGAEYDQLVVTGTAVLNGRLRARLIDGFVPTNGNSFAVLTCGSRSNAFPAVDLPALAPGVVWDVVYTGTSVTLRVVDAGADSDGDGMPNGWEYDHFGSATGADPNAPAANGVNTLLEAYAADLNPTNPASVFPPITGIGDPVWVLVVNPSSTARVYDVEWRTNLLQVPPPWTPYGFDRFGTGSNLNFTITNTGPVRFYRTRVRLP